MENTVIKTGFIGMGNMGSAIANLIAGNGYTVLGWDHNIDVVKEINKKNSNSLYLPGIALDKKITASGKLEEVFSASNVVFIAIPSVFIASTLEPFKGKIEKETIFVNMSKGIDSKLGLTSFQILDNLFPENRQVMLSGPSIAAELAVCSPTVVALASRHKQGLVMISRLVDSDCFRTRHSGDVVGVELGGILKNMYAIGLGFFDGLKITSVNFRSVYLTLALEEMVKFGEKMGAGKETFYYISGLGDLLATSLSAHSHNRTLGELLAKGRKISEIEKIKGVLPEGYNTIKSVLYLAEKNHVAMPLAKALFDAINGDLKVEKFIQLFLKGFAG